MATSFLISCPECDKQMKVMDQHVGKKVRCKSCENVFVVKQPKATAQPPTPPKKASPPPAKAVEVEKPKASSPHLDDDDDDSNPYQMIVEKEELPRCPFCAVELVSADAVICRECGYNMKTRQRPEVKVLLEHTFADKLNWYGLAIFYTFMLIVFIVWDAIFFVKIEGWLVDSVFIEEDGGGYVGGLRPGFWKLLMTAPLVVLAVPMVRYSYRRFFVQTIPDKKLENEGF
ncbi:MAG: hypothetical protein R3B84_12420 [Zavarzinella sp.]